MNMKPILRIPLCALLLCATLAISALAAPVKLIALTFDDGPDNDFTPKILSTLKEKGAKATFFVMGEYLIDKSYVLNRELWEGHQQGSHTFDHLKLPTLSDAQVKDQLDRLRDKVREMTGRPDAVYWLRPPYGVCDSRVSALAGTPVIHWSIDAAQGKTVPGDQMAKYIIQNAFDGAIVLMHDTTQFNADAIPVVIDALQAQGYEFVTVRELFRLKGVAPQNGVVYRKVVGPNPLTFDEKALSTHWAYPYISYVRSQKLMSGDAGGFRPNHPVTRAMAATLLWRAAGAPASHYTPGFRDVPAGSWAYPGVAWSAANSLLRPQSRDCLGADTPVTREEFYFLLAALARRELREAPDTAPDIPAYQDDRRTAGWARDDVVYLRQMGFFSVNDVELFRPQDNLTRAEAAELLSWYLTG